jgi:hypothetical protein
MEVSTDLLPLCQGQVECSTVGGYLLPTHHSGSLQQGGLLRYHRYLLQVEKYPQMCTTVLPTYFRCGSIRHRSRPTCLDRQQHSRQGHRSEYG